MGKIFKNKKVITAIVVLLVTVAAVGLKTDFGPDAANQITNVICSFVACE
ncbi:hypothetical protein VL73_47 [Erwinia phage VL73]